MEQMEYVQDPSVHALEEPATRHEPSHQYAPADFLREFGAVIAICLGLALMANVLVAIIGQ